MTPKNSGLAETLAMVESWIWFDSLHPIINLSVI